MTYEEHYLCHKALDKFELKIDEILNNMQPSKNKNELMKLIYGIKAPLLTLKHYMDEDFCRNTKTGISLYFGGKGERANKDYWLVVKKNWIGKFGAARKLFKKAWTL